MNSIINSNIFTHIFNPMDIKNLSNLRLSNKLLYDICEKYSKNLIRLLYPNYFNDDDNVKNICKKLHYIIGYKYSYFGIYSSLITQTIQLKLQYSNNEIIKIFKTSIIPESSNYSFICISIDGTIIKISSVGVEKNSKVWIQTYKLAKIPVKITRDHESFLIVECIDGEKYTFSLSLFNKFYNKLDKYNSNRYNQLFI